MPRSTQIIPKYTFPHEEVYINDNSAQDITQTTSETLTMKYLAVFASAKGIDNKLVSVSSLDDYYATFGKTNYAKYGQPHLMPEAYLSNSNVEVWCLRVMPDDAKYANSVLSLWYKEDVANKAFRIKFTAKNLSDADVAEIADDTENPMADRDLINDCGALLDGVAVDGAYVDDEGYTQVPLAVFTAQGRGVYGNNLRWRITQNTEYEKDYSTKFYTFEILDVENGVTVVQATNATIVPNPALDIANFVNDVIEDADASDIAANIHVFDENVENLYNKYVAFCNTVVDTYPDEVITIPDITIFDPFFGLNLKKSIAKAATAQPYITFVAKKTDDISDDDENIANYTEMDIVTLDNVAGNNLDNGDDGAFGSTDEDARNAAYEEMYQRAFLGDVDKLILSARRIPVETLYDANYSMETKAALVRLALHRMDAPVHLDTGFRESLGTIDIANMVIDFTPIEELVDEFDTLENNFLLSVDTHDYKIKEACTGKRVRVTITYYLAQTDPVYLRANDESPIPRTGSNAVLSGHIKDSLNPAIDESDSEIKQALSDACINFFEATGVNRFERATDHTFIKPADENTSNSDLAIENNVIALLDLKRAMEAEFRANRNNITTPDRRKDMRDYLLAKYEYLKGTRFDTFDIKYKANEYESKRNITHVYVAVTFYPRSEITLIEIDVNQKTYQADSDDE
jgi:hypothetical protein